MQSRVRSAVWALVIAIYFFRFQAPSVRCTFNGDDMMNLAYFWRPGAQRLATALVAFWSGYYRPMGGVFYVPLYSAFGLDPVPFRVLDLGVFALALIFVFRTARLLSGSLEIAGFTTVACTYYGPMSEMTYYTGFIFDVLCNLFYFAAFSVYLQPRSEGRPISAPRLAGTAALYLCALNSKEMAVTLPIALLVYELVYHRPRTIRAAQLLPVLVLAALTLVYVVGRTTGPQALSKQSGYQPEISWQGFLVAKYHYWHMLFDRPEWHTRIAAIALCVALVAIVIWRRKPHLVWCWFMTWLVTLPIDFIPLRGTAMLFLFLFPVALAATAVLSDAIRWTAGVAAQHAGAWRAAVVVILWIPFLWAHYHWNSIYFSVRLNAVSNDRAIITMIDQVRSLNLRLPPRSRVMILSDPWPTYDMAFIAELSWNDRSLVVHLYRHHSELSREQILATYDWVLDYQDGRLFVVKPG